jgi:CMP-2-keto-3-deoxyoctulosonic acid synthetase
MRTLVVIPARLGAMRLPRKPLRLLSGLPLIVRVWQRISQMNLADTVSWQRMTTLSHRPSAMPGLIA